MEGRRAFIKLPGAAFEPDQSIWEPPCFHRQLASSLQSHTREMVWGKPAGAWASAVEAEEEEQGGCYALGLSWTS